MLCHRFGMEAPSTSQSESLTNYLAATDAELRVFIDPEHMSYLPIYLGRADARHALGAAPAEVLRELWLAAKVFATHGGIFLTKWPAQQIRRRRLEPLEVALIAGDPDVLKAITKRVGLDPMVLFAGIEPDEITAEVAAITDHFKTGSAKDPIDLAGALALYYWLMLAAVADQDAEAFDAARRRALRLLDDMGHLLGGVAQGGIARIKAIYDVINGLNPARPDNVAKAIVRHAALAKIEYEKAQTTDPEARDHAKGSLDRTALALLAMAKGFGLELGQALIAAGADARMLAYAQALGHTSAT